MKAKTTRVRGKGVKKKGVKKVRPWIKATKKTV